MAGGFIKLHRSILEWEWYRDIPVRILFEHCLLKAAHEVKRWRGIIIERGSFVTSIKKLAAETGLTAKQIRTAIGKLSMTDELAHEGHSSYSIITIKKWNFYQAEGKQGASEGQTKGKQKGMEWANEGQGLNAAPEPVLDILINPEGQTKGTRSDADIPQKGQQTRIKKEEERKEEEKNINIDSVVVEEEEKEIEKSKNACCFRGEFSNVFLPSKRYDALFAMILDEKILQELINELSETIARKNDKFKPYDELYPDAHYLYLKAFWRYRKEHPEKFLHKDADTGGAESTQERAKRVYEQYLRGKEKIKNEAGRIYQQGF